jgi:MoxR-like ATPase
MLERIQTVAAQVGGVVVGKQPQIKLALACLLARGHLLIEDLPGVGKTTLAHALSMSLGLQFKRVQFTNDLLPADILGLSVFDRDNAKFVFHPGPVFSQVLLADEINRASPKVQSALLEAMQERRVSIGQTTHDLPAPFLVIATQNPVEQSGTFELPEAQLDRFMLRHRLGYPSPEDEAEVVRRHLALKLKKHGEGAVPMSAFDAIGTEGQLHVRDLTEAMSAVQRVHVSEVFIRDCVELVNLTRTCPDVELGCSPRAGLALVQASRARAFIHGRDYTIPEDFFALAEDVILHRMRLTYEALAAGRKSSDVLEGLLRKLT